MPGPKMGPRPADFSEELVKQSPTFQKWESLAKGEKLRYACRDFIKGQPQDEERLMRRIMIARRNNLRDHAILKRARNKQDGSSEGSSVEAVPVPVPTKPASNTTATTAKCRKRRPASTFSDGQVAKEMDVAAVEATRSYRAWMALADGEEFIYNQKYYKGKPNQDWLLRKNIWRRMRYRRENKKLVTQLREDDPSISVPRKPTAPPSASEIVDQALASTEDQESGTTFPPLARSEAGDAPSDTYYLTTTATNTDHSQATAGIKRIAVDAPENEEKMPRTDTAELRTAAATSTFPIVQNPVPADDTTLSLQEQVPLQPHAQPLSRAAPPAPQPVAQSDPSHRYHQALSTTTSTDDETAHAALTAAAAATASGAADDLVELSAVEAAVAAAANYVAAHHDDDDDDDDEDDDDDDDDHHVPRHHHTTTVHNPLEAAANAAALDSAAKLAAAATAHDVASQQVTDEETVAMEVAAEEVRVISV